MSTHSLAGAQYAATTILPKSRPHYSRNTNSSFASLSPSPSPRNSSLQKVWAEDYLDHDYAAEKESNPDTSFDLIAPPPPATLTSSRLVKRNNQAPSEDEPSSTHHRQNHRSLTSLLPFRIRSTPQSPERSPTKETAEQDFMPTLTGDKDGQIKMADKTKGISSWFSGSSTPMPVGIPVTEQEVSSNTTTASFAKVDSPNKLRKQQTMPNLETQKPAASTSLFTLFGSPKSPKQKETVQLPAKLVENDYLLTLDISSALYPQGVSSEKDPFSPAAFKNLMQNAEGLLAKLQSSYKLRTLSLHELTAEKDAQKEELEEAETRATHLKLQLEDMAKKVTEQDKVVENLVEELAKEREARRQENEAREKSIALIKARRLAAEQRNSSTTSLHSDQEAEIDEDLGISRAGSHHRRDSTWRHSNGSNAILESDDDVDTHDSVFSRSRSPTLIDSSATSIITEETASIDIPSTNSSTPEILQASQARVMAAPPVTANAHQQRVLASQRPKTIQQTSTFSKILRGGSVSNSVDEAKEDDVNERCRNCHGGDAGVAWDSVGLLKMENKGLKSKVEVLEGGVDGTLDLITGWGY